MADELATNPVNEGDTFVQDTAPETQEVDTTEGLEPELDDEGNPVEPVAEDEEIDLDDLKLKVPKDQAEKVRLALLRQADYTRKTQELAEARKAVQAERESVQQASAAEVQAQAAVVAIDQQLAGYQNVDWNALWENDPLEAPRHWAQYQGLLQSREHAAQQFVGLRQQRTERQQQETAKRLQEATAELVSDPEIKWSPQKAAEMLSGAQQHYKLDTEEVNEAFQQARLVRILHDALQWREHQKAQKKAQGHVAAQAVKPAAKVGGGSSPPVGLDDRLSMDEWQKRREKQVRQRA